MRRKYQNQLKGPKKDLRQKGRRRLLKLRSFLENYLTTLPVAYSYNENLRPVVENYVGKIFNDDATTLPASWPKALVFSEDLSNYSRDLIIKTEFSYGKMMIIDSDSPSLAQGKFNQLVDILFEPFTNCGYNTLGKLVGVCRNNRIDVNEKLPRVMGELIKNFFSYSEKYHPALYEVEKQNLDQEVVNLLQKYVDYVDIEEGEDIHNGAFYILAILAGLGVCNFLDSIYVHKNYLNAYAKDDNAMDVFANLTNLVVRGLFNFMGLLPLEEIKKYIAMSIFSDLMYDMSAPLKLADADYAPTSKDFCINPEFVEGAKTSRLESERKKEERKNALSIKRKVDRAKAILEEYGEEDTDEEVDTDNE